MNTHTRGHMTAQTAAGSGTEEETHAAAGVGPALAAETRCASKPASAAAWAARAAASRESQPAGARASPRAPAAGRRGRRAAPRLASAGGRGQRRGRGRRRQEAGAQEPGGVRGCRWSFSINKDPDWIGGFFPFFLPSVLPGLAFAFGGAAVQQPGGGGPGRVRVGAPGSPRRDGGNRDGGSRLHGAPGLRRRCSRTQPAAQCAPAWLQVPSSRAPAEPGGFRSSRARSC